MNQKQLGKIEQMHREARTALMFAAIRADADIGDKINLFRTQMNIKSIKSRMEYDALMFSRRKIIQPTDLVLLVQESVQNIINGY